MGPLLSFRWLLSRDSPLTRLERVGFFERRPAFRYGGEQCPGRDSGVLNGAAHGVTRADEPFTESHQNVPGHARERPA